jgi:hypothetical protein
MYNAFIKTSYVIIKIFYGISYTSVFYFASLVIKQKKNIGM